MKLISIIFFLLLITGIIMWVYTIPKIPIYNFQSNELFSPVYGTIKKIETKEDKHYITISRDIGLNSIYLYSPCHGNIQNNKIKNIMWGTDINDRFIEINDTNLQNGIVRAGEKIGFSKSINILICSAKYLLNIKSQDKVYGPLSKIGIWI